MHILGDREAREHVLRLRHEADAPRDEFVGTQIRDVLPFERELAGVDVHEAEQRLEQRGLAGAVRADDAHDLAVVQCERGAVQDVDARQVAGDQIVGVEQRLARMDMRAVERRDVGGLGWGQCCGVRHCHPPILRVRSRRRGRCWRGRPSRRRPRPGRPSPSWAGLRPRSCLRPSR